MTSPAVLVTGGATRIGAEIVKRFAAAGWHTIIHFKSSDDEAKALAAKLPSASIYGCDLADRDAAVAMIEALARTHDDFRCLINSASVFEYDDAQNLDPAIYATAMQVNALAPALMTQAFLKHARSTQGRSVIQITDQKLQNSNPDFFSYTMSKHALDATIAMLAKPKLADSDRVYGIAPGAILASHDQTQDETETSHRLNLLHRKTGAEEIANAALYLASGHARSGTTLYIDSGQHLLNQDRDVIYLARGKGDAA